MEKNIRFQVFIIAMRISLIQILIAGWFISGAYAIDGNAQSLLSQKVTLRIQKQEVEQLLTSIEKQVNAKFVFSSKIIQSDKRISISVREEPLYKVLNEVFTAQNLDYRVSGNLIIISRPPTNTPGSSAISPSGESTEKIAGYSVSGKVTDSKGEALIGTTILINYQNRGQVADKDGHFTFNNIPEGQYILSFSSVGFSSAKKEISINGGDIQVNMVLQEDNLQLEQVIVTSSGSPKKKIESSVAISTISAKQLSQKPPLNSTDLLKAIPGLSPESSGGDGPGSVRVRGLPAGGYIFMGVMEDGLQVLPTGFSNTPSSDQYYKVDLTVKTVEAVRGGNAAIILANTPGALINVISQTGGDVLAGKIKFTRGLSQNANRVDFNLGGPLSQKIKFNIGGFYRMDDGIRPASYRSTEGGQLKLNLTYNLTPKTYLRFYGKYLNDKTGWLLPSYYSYDGSGLGEALPNFDLLTQTLATRDTKVTLNAPNGQTYNFNLADGVKTELSYGGIEFNHFSENGWNIKNNLRYQNADAVFNGGFISAPQAYLSTAKYYYLDGQQLINPTGYYTGQSFAGSISSDKQFIDNLDINKQFGKHSITFGAAIHSYHSEILSLGAAFATEVTDKPRILLVNTPAGTGFSGTNISGFRNGTTLTSSLLASDEINLNDLTIDLGFRADRFDISGKRLINAAPYTNYTPFDESNTYTTSSLGLNYKVNERNAIFGRATSTYSALNITDYSNFAFNPSGVRDRSIFMSEIGYKVNLPKFSLFSSLIYAKLTNISSSMSVPDTKGTFIAVPTFASSKNISAEIEAVYSPLKNLNFRITATVQNSKYEDYQVTAPTNAREDLAGKPFIYSGNKAERIPDLLYEFSVNYSYRIFDVFASIRHVGKRWSSPSNVYQLGAYDEFSLGIDARVSKSVGLRIWGDNLLNSRGLTEGNVRGDQFLANGDFAKGSMQIGRMILPRSLWASFTYSF